MGMLALAHRLAGRQRWLMMSAWAITVVLAFAFLAPTQLVLRFSEISSEGRLDVGKETLHLIAAYSVFGTGLGGYESAFEKFKTTGYALAQDYAHNDYLQYLAELGIVGFMIGATFLFLILAKSVRFSLRYPDSDIRWLGLDMDQGTCRHPNSQYGGFQSLRSCKRHAIGLDMWSRCGPA